MEQFYLIPSELAIKVLKERLWREFQVWLVLKSTCNGHIKITEEIKEDAAMKIGVSVRTFERSLKSLLNMNWVGKSRKFYFIRGIDAVRKIEGITNRSAYWFNITDAKKIRGFCMGIAVSEIEKKIKFKLRTEGSLTEKRGVNFTAPSVPIALEYLFQSYGIKKRNASVLRKKACPDFIEMRENLIPIIYNNEKIKCSGRFRIIKSGIIEGHKIKCIGGFLFEQGPNLVKSKINKKRRQRI